MSAILEYTTKDIPAIGMLAIGITAIMFGVIRWFNYKNKRVHALRAVGTVIGYKTVSNRPKIHYPIIEFSSLDGSGHRVTYSEGSSRKFWKPGTKMEIMYFPGKEEQMTVASPKYNSFTTLFPIGIGTFFAILAILQLMK